MEIIDNSNISNNYFHVFDVYLDKDCVACEKLLLTKTKTRNSDFLRNAVNAIDVEYGDQGWSKAVFTDGFILTREVAYG